jgi:hypothetical protein
MVYTSLSHYRSCLKESIVVILKSPKKASVYVAVVLALMAILRAVAAE